MRSHVGKRPSLGKSLEGWACSEQSWLPEASLPSVGLPGDGFTCPSHRHSSWSGGGPLLPSRCSRAPSPRAVTGRAVLPFSSSQLPGLPSSPRVSPAACARPFRAGASCGSYPCSTVPGAPAPQPASPTPRVSLLPGTRLLSLQLVRAPLLLRPCPLVSLLPRPRTPRASARTAARAPASCLLLVLRPFGSVSLPLGSLPWPSSAPSPSLSDLT